MSLESMVAERVSGRLRPHPAAGRAQPARRVGERVSNLADVGSMRVLEGIVAMAAIVTAVLIGLR